jgi:RND family efflux transporter MFP subunit
VRATSCAQAVTGFAVVWPRAPATVAAIASGIVAGLTMVPGDRVASGQVLAKLTGPEVSAAVVQASAAVAAAQAEMQAARAALAADRAKLPERLVTRQDMAQAEANLAAASAKLNLSQADRSRLQQALSIAAPIAGIVQSVSVGDGSRVASGATILTIQPAAGRFLSATLYGRAAFRIGIGAVGEFAPASGGSADKVTVTGIGSRVVADGGVALTVSFAGASPWPGTFGRLEFSLPPQSLPAVPNRALILDRGKWWVVVHRGDSDQPVQVVPGPVLRDRTCIEHGLTVGQQVVTVNPYLAYNRGIAAQYQPPD